MTQIKQTKDQQIKELAEAHSLLLAKNKVLRSRITKLMAIKNVTLSRDNKYVHPLEQQAVNVCVSMYKEHICTGWCSITKACDVGLLILEEKLKD